MEYRSTFGEKVPFEEALNRTGFGLYSYLNTLLSGLSIISMSFIVYGATMIVPASACELQTTGAQQGLLVAAPIVGLILGGPLWGYLGDTRGRRSMLIVSLVVSAIINAVSAFSVNWIMMMILQFISSVMAAASYSLAMTLLSESVPMAKRNVAVLMVSSLFMLTQGLMAVLAIPIIPLTFFYHIPVLDIYWSSWRTLVLVYSLPSIISACCYCFTQDSPKFALVRGDEKKALGILKAIHKVNHRKGAVLDVHFLVSDVAHRPLGHGLSDQLLPLFKAPLLKHTIILSILFMFQLSGSFQVWLPTIANRVIRMYETGEVASLTLCGILNADIDMSQSTGPCAFDLTSLLMVLLVCVVQSLLNTFLSLVVVTRVGRRNTSIGLVTVVGVSGILINLVSNTIGTIALFAVFQMGYLVMGLYTAMAVALFPTHLRATAVALTTTLGSITTFACLQVVNFMLFTNCELCFFLFCSIFTSSAIVAFFLPDDRIAQKPSPKDQQSRKGSHSYSAYRVRTSNN